MQNLTPKATRNLIDRVLSGEPRAFQTLIEQNQRLVIHIVFRMVSHAADREDLCQDIFMKVYQNLPKFRHQSKLSTWIATIAYNTCINHLQKKRALLYDDVTPDEKTLDNVSADVQRPDKITEDMDISGRLQEEIERLDVRYRSILTLYHLHGMSYAEIGRIMKLPEGTVKSYLFRARKALRTRLILQYEREEL